MRISVTDLDAYRYYRDNEDTSLDDLLARLRREMPPTPAMLAGKALHSALETLPHIDGGSFDVLEADSFKFRFACDAPLPLLKVRELKGEMQLGPVTLVGVVDGIGGETQDHKLTGRWDAERYADSFQWRCYLVMFGGRRFTYNVFVGQDKGDEWLITEFHRLSLYAYPGIREDVVREVEEFAAFLRKHPPESRSLSALLLASIDGNSVASQA